jgi:hypothetical protein
MQKTAKAEASKVDLIIVGDKGNIFFFTCGSVTEELLIKIWKYLL